MSSIAPKVSVVAPAFRASETVREMMDSVLGQSMPDLELVICDDASDDDTCAIVLGYRDDRVRLVRNPTNLGPGPARDRAIMAARGDWIAVIDADDAWAPQRLARLLEGTGDARDVMVFDNIMLCHHAENGPMLPWRPLRSEDAFGGGATARDVTLPDYIRSERLLIKPVLPRRFLVDARVHHSSRRFAEDAEYFIRLGLAGLRLRYVPEPMYRYRSMPGSATAQAGAHHLMRECIEACASLPGLAPDVYAAFREKIGTLERHERLYALAGAVRRLRLGEALGMVLREPSLLLYASRFALRRVHYTAHRLRHSAKGR